MSKQTSILTVIGIVLAAWLVGSAFYAWQKSKKILSTFQSIDSVMVRHQNKFIVVYDPETFSVANRARVSQLKIQTESACVLIDSIKNNLLTAVENNPKHKDTFITKKDIARLKTTLQNYSAFVGNAFPELKINSLGGINTDDANYDNEKQSWEQEYFEYTPTAAVAALLTKFKNDIRLIEKEIIMGLN